MGVLLFNMKGLTMPVSKTRKGGRSTAKQYTFVKFEFEGFNDPFEFPSFDQVPVRVAIAVPRGDIEVLINWLVASGADKTAIEDFGDLSTSEVEKFTEAWQAGQPVGLGKSAS